MPNEAVKRQEMRAVLPANKPCVSLFEIPPSVGMTW